MNWMIFLPVTGETLTPETYQSGDLAIPGTTRSLLFAISYFA